MTSKNNGIAANSFVIFLSLVLLSSLSHATFPTTLAISVSNFTGYSFGTWTDANVSIVLQCIGGTSDCNATTYCLGTNNTCNPSVNGTLYTGPITISTEGTSYINYASNNSTGGWGDNKSGTIEIDTTAPLIPIIDNASATWTNNDTIAVAPNDGNGSGINETEWIMTPSQVCNSSLDSLFANNTTSNVGAIMHADNDSVYLNQYICFRTVDFMGHESFNISSKITRLDTTRPTVNAGPNVTANSQFTQSGAASDSGSGIDYYTWSELSGPGAVTFSSSNSATATISANADGTYVVQLAASDNAGNTGNSTFTLNWVTSLPAISINNPGTTPAHSKTISASASKGTLTMATTTSTLCDGSLSFFAYAPITFSNQSNNGEMVCYRSIDSAGNTAYGLSAPIAGIDYTAPAITMVGSSPVIVQVFGTYADAGATATDQFDGNITSEIMASGIVNTSAVGNYTITYTVTDSAGNSAAPVTRTVEVMDTMPPVITLLGNSSVTVEIRSNYTDAGATATDNYDGDLTSQINTGGIVNTSTAGTYTLTYDVRDSSGNRAAELTRTVIVVDSVAPIIAGIEVIVVVAIIVAIGWAAYMYVNKQHKGL